MSGPSKPSTYVPEPTINMWGEKRYEARILHDVQVWTTVAKTVGYFPTRQQAEEAAATALNAYIKQEQDR